MKNIQLTKPFTAFLSVLLILIWVGGTVPVGAAVSTASLSAELREETDGTYADVTFHTDASARKFDYVLSYDPTLLEYVSTSSAASGIRAVGTASVTPGKKKQIIDASAGDRAVDFDFSDSFSYTNTTGESLSSMPAPTLITMRVRYTGTSQDHNQALLQTFVNGANYYPCHRYVFCEECPEGQWFDLEMQTHSNPPAADGHNTLTVSVYRGITLEIASVSFYSGWDTSSAPLTQYLFAGDGEETDPVGEIAVATSSTFSKTGNIARCTFRVLKDGADATLGLSVTNPQGIAATPETTVTLPTQTGVLSAYSRGSDLCFGFALPVDGQGEYFLTETGTLVRPTEKGFLAALGKHAPADMQVTADPYVLRFPVTTAESVTGSGHRYTLAVTEPHIPLRGSVAVRFYVAYTQNGQKKYAYSSLLSVNRALLSDHDEEHRYFGESPEKSAGLSVNNTTSVCQSWQGANAVAQGFIYNNGYTDEQIGTELSRMEDMGINMVRSYFDPSFNMLYMTTRNRVSYVYDRERMTALISWLTAMKQRGISVALNMGWGLSEIFENEATCYDEYSTGNPDGEYNPLYQYYVNNDRDKTLTLYGQWVNKSVDYLINQMGFTNITHLILFTEPGVSSTGHDYRADYADFVRVTDSALRTGGNRDLVKLVGPNIGMGSNPFTSSLENDLKYFENIADCIDVYSFHFYAPHWPGRLSLNTAAGPETDNYSLYYREFETCVNFAKSHGKPYWFDEFNYSPGNAGIPAAQEDPLMGTQYAQTLAAAMNTGTENVFLWQLFEIRWPGRFTSGGEFEKGVHVIGLAPTLNESPVPYTPYYAYSLLSRYLGERGSSVYAGTGQNGAYSVMTEGPDGQRTVLLINTASVAQQVTVSFARSLNGCDLARIVYDPAAVTPEADALQLGPDRVFKGVTGSFTDCLPPNSFAVYTTDF